MQQLGEAAFMVWVHFSASLLKRRRRLVAFGFAV